MPLHSGRVIHVVAGVIRNRAGAVLLAQRPDGKPMAGRWEFPGGKLLDGEPAEHGLARELSEELGITVKRPRPLIQLHHDYPELSVDLEIFHVDDFHGEPRALEGQPLAWVPVDELPRRDLLAADRAIVAALRLPDRCLVTPLPGGAPEDYLAAAEASLACSISLMQCRLPETHAGWLTIATSLRELCTRHGVDFIWNGAPAEAEGMGADGVHLNARRLLASTARPLPAARWVGASCHNEAEVRHANRLGLDYIFIGAVQPTPSHPGGATLGWDGFARLVRLSNLPAFAIGGMGVDDIPRAQSLGGQGVAAIRGLWAREVARTDAWD